MKKLVNILFIAFIYLFLNNSMAFSQVDPALPSEQTWDEIQSTTNAIDNQSPSLRAAPPDGPGIGETPIGETSIAILILTGMAYVIFQKKRAFKQK